MGRVLRYACRCSIPLRCSPCTPPLYTSAFLLALASPRHQFAHYLLSLKHDLPPPSRSIHPLLVTKASLAILSLSGSSPYYHSPRFGDVPVYHVVIHTCGSVASLLSQLGSALQIAPRVDCYVAHPPSA